MHKNMVYKKCPRCSGHGGNTYKDIELCPECEGRGRWLEEVDLTPPGSSHNHDTHYLLKECDLCGGIGHAVVRACPVCGGLGVSEQEEEMRVEIPALSQSGDKSIAKGVGNLLPGRSDQTPGDLVFLIECQDTIETSEGFTIKRENKTAVVVEIPITLEERRTGIKNLKIPFGTAEDEFVDGEVPPNVQHGALFPLKEYPGFTLYGKALVVKQKQ